MDELTIRPIARIRSDFLEKFTIPRQSGLVRSLRAEVVFEQEYRDMSADEIKQIMEADGPEAKEINAYHAEMEEKANRLMDKLNAAQEHTTEKYVELDASASFLQSEQGILSSQKTDLNTQILEVEQIDLADAITRMSYDQMCYNAALKIGTQLLSQSLVDYMN